MPVSKLWTHDKDYKGSVPEIDDYDKWSADQIRHECSSRKLGIKKGTNKDDRIVFLINHDSMTSNLVPIISSPPPRSPTRSRSCIYCLLNILFDDKYCDNFSTLGNSFCRRDFDECKSFEQKFWDSVAEAFKTDGMYDVLLQTDELIKQFDSSRIIPHSSAKLESMWKEIKGKYKIAKSNFTKSGTHESDFRMFCDGNGGVLYLHLCLQSKPELTNYVCEGFLNGDKFDSLDFTPSSKASSSVNSRNVISYGWKNIFVGYSYKYD